MANLVFAAKAIFRLDDNYEEKLIFARYKVIANKR
jgi:hypothetical protein